MELEFQEKDYGWREAKLTVNADFNVHLEINPEKAGRIIDVFLFLLHAITSH